MVVIHGVINGHTHRQTDTLYIYDIYIYIIYIYMIYIYIILYIYAYMHIHTYEPFYGDQQTNMGYFSDTEIRWAETNTNPPKKRQRENILGPFPSAVECHVLLQLGIAMSKCHLGPSNVTGIKVQEHPWNVARHQPRCGRGAACEGQRQMDAHNIVTWWTIGWYWGGA